jgi:hypothetical protein
MTQPTQPTYLQFVALLGVVLEEGQRVYAKVAYDHVAPRDLPPEERAIARQIFGDIEEVPAAAHKVVGSVIGGRAGKSYLATLRLLHLCCTVSLDGILAPGQRAHAAIVAPDVETAKEDVGYFIGACASHPKLRRCVSKYIVRKVIDNGEMVERFVFRRPRDGRLIEVAVRAVQRGGRNVRGRWYVGALLDEACLFYDSSYKLSDDQVYKAIKPRIVVGGQLLLSSTPWLDSGVLYTLWESEFGRPATALVAHAPTLVLRPHDPHIREVVEGEFKTDPENARREFGAEFGTGAPSDWFDKAQLKACVQTGQALAPAQPGEKVGAGGDLGFVRNSSALVVAVHDPLGGGRVRVCRNEERRPLPGAPLRPSEVCAEFAGVLVEEQARGMVADQHYAESAREELDKARLLLLDPPSNQEEPWVFIRQLVRDGLLDLPDATETDRLLVQQLGSIQVRRAPRGRILVVLPQTKDGRHGDVAAAAVLAIWAAVHQGHLIPLPPEARDPRELQLEHLRRPPPGPAGGHWMDRANRRGMRAA